MEFGSGLENTGFPFVCIGLEKLQLNRGNCYGQCLQLLGTWGRDIVETSVESRPADQSQQTAFREEAKG